MPEPTPVPDAAEGLTEAERRLVEEWKSYYPDPPTGVTNANHVCHLLAIIDRLTASPAPLPECDHNFVNPANALIEDNGWLVCLKCGLLSPPLPDDEER